MVEEKWKGCKVKGFASYRFAYKLEELKRGIKEWAKVEVSKEKCIFESIMSEIGALDKKEDMDGLNEEERDKKGSLLKLAAHLKAEKISWRQKSREK